MTKKAKSSTSTWAWFNEYAKLFFGIAKTVSVHVFFYKQCSFLTKHPCSLTFS